MAKKTTILEELRGRLLDLSLRNNLLNYHLTAPRSIEINDEHIGEVYSTLVLKEKGMIFHPSGKAAATSEEKNLWKYPIFTINSKHRDLILNTPYSDIELRKKLDALQTKSRTVFEEQGYPILYLALGFIEWNDATNKGLKAPLLLVPVSLSREKVKENYTLSWSGEDPFISPTLSAKLADDGLFLSEFGHPDTKEEVAKFLEGVNALISRAGWKLIPEIVLDLFSFKKYVMYKDLDPSSWGEGFFIEESPLVRSIFAPTAADMSTPETLPLKSSDFTCIMDADSSQLAVIAEAKTGRNLVVEGPPGTGKSQTIANMIAEMLAAGKSVLFVSEKMAALQVVKRRLDAAGLSRFLLELHSQNAKKTDFLRELETCLMKRSEPLQVTDITEDTKTKIETISAELSGYCDELKKPTGECGFTPYDLFGIREQYRYEFEEVRKEHLPSVEVKKAESITPEEYREAVAALTDIVSYLPTLLHDGETIATHPWAGTNPGRLLPTEREEIRDTAKAFSENIKDIIKILKDTAEFAGLPFVPKNEKGLTLFLETCKEIVKEYPLTKEVIENPAWQNKTAVAHLLEQYNTIYSMRKTVNEVFTPDIHAKDCKELYETYLKASEKGALSRIFSSAYKNLRTEIRACLKNPKLSDADILTGLRDVKIYAAGMSEWNENKAECAYLFSPVWAGDDTNPELLKEYATWIYILRAWDAEGRITHETILKIIDGKLTGCSAVTDELEQKYQIAKAARDALIERLHIENVEESPDFADLDRTAERWVSDIERLEAWSRFQTYISLAEKTAAADSARLAFAGRLSAESIIPSFVLGYSDSLLNETYKKRPCLAQFAQTPHEQKIETFKILDKKVIRENGKTLTRTLSKRMPELFAGASRESEMGILAGEFNRKRGHMAIRSLMTKAGGLIQKIKPCFMMSPLSVAQYLDPRSVTFDIIIFDEASQVKPEDALGALMRGRQLVVMGDSRQLPPTSFFDSVGRNDEDDEDECSTAAEITDMESLLHACKQVYPVRRLTWHYRSRHESLIAVSNAQFYDGSLFVFPSPKHETTDLGLSFVHLKDTTYDRGNTGTNRGEAKAVAAAVIEYYRQFPGKTLGVATFSSRQQEVIRREVDLLLRDNSDVEALMHSNCGEEFFVKNLETVQGDERDTILISIGYGYDAEHNLSRNFGPLNQTGGERRLNVLITRARERCVVFSNFRGYDLQITPETPRGVAALASFLIYAETRNNNVLTKTDEETAAQDRFADSVARMLMDKGYAVSRNVGCAGFRVDIAVAHPDDSGIFMAGILCDGHNYWSAADVRDRDRLRTQILEGLGWNLIRIWAPEWFCAPKECGQKLLKKLKKAITPVAKKEEKILPVIKTEEAPRVTLRKVAENSISEDVVDADSSIDDVANESVSEMDDVEIEPEKKLDEVACEVESVKTEPVKKSPRKRAEKKPAVSASAEALVQQIQMYSAVNKPAEESATEVKERRSWRNLPAEINFPQYVSAKKSVLQKYHQFSSVEDITLKTAIVEITAVEGPISENSLYARIKELGNVSRMTQAIKSRISECVKEVAADGQLERDEEGFISIPDGKLIPRVRGDGWLISDVSLYELLLAAQIILMRQYATPKTDLAKATGSIFGFKATAQVKERCEKAIVLGIDLGIIIEKDGMCTVKS